MHLSCLFDLSTCSKTVFDFSKADFYGLRDHFSKYNDWTLLIDLDINEGLKLIKKQHSQWYDQFHSYGITEA